jgi:threonine dehydrogenase-like Zn-dependent dehydrogenase
MSCIINAFHANYHVKSGTTIHEMGIKSGGRCAILAGAGPMGLGAVDYALHSDRRPGQLVVTDIDQTRLNRAASILTPEEARKNGVELHYVNTAAMKDPVRELKALSKGTGFDDIFVFAPVKPVIELGDSVLGTDGCMNFFAGPTNPAFKAEINFYNVHYAFTKIMGTTGGSTDDMKESLDLMSRGKLNPSAMITHVGGLTAAIETTLNLPSIPGGKKLIYTEIDMELIAIDDLAEKGKSNPLYRKLAEITSRNNGLWSAEAEEYLLKNGKKL